MNLDFLKISLIGPTLFLLTAFVFGLVKPQYRPLHHTISELALGRYGYVQTANFIFCGLLIAVLGFRVAATHEHLWGSFAVIVLGLVLLLSAVFRTDPISANGSTQTGKVHNGLFFIGMLGIISGQFVTGLTGLGSALGVFSLACGVLTFIAMAMTVARRTYMGAFQRVLVLIVMLWVTGFALSTLGW